MIEFTDEQPYILWLQDLDMLNPKIEFVSPNVVFANESGYYPQPDIMWSKAEAQRRCDEFNKAHGLTPAQCEAILASSMFYRNGVRYPANLKRYEKYVIEWPSEGKVQRSRRMNETARQ